MSDVFYFVHSHKFKKQKVVLRKARFLPAEINLLMQGLYYARIRDSITERQNEYKKLLAKLNEVIHGKRNA